MASDNALIVRSAQAVERSACPIVSVDRFRQFVIEGVAEGWRISALLPEPSADLSGRPLPGGEGSRLLAVLARPASGDLAMLACEVNDAYPALTPECPSAHRFEREIAEQWNIRPEGHPWLKPIRFAPPRRPACSLKRAWQAGGAASQSPIGVTDFFHMDGEEIHEVAVGPVHAGVIEPGHFRFQCQGETVHHLEISLGYQHRGVERAMIGGPSPRTIHYMETLAGDTTIGHATAYCLAVEAMAGVRPTARDEAIRAIALELERIANHIGDLGAMAGDVGFLPTMSYCGRIRGDVLNLTAAICGSRFGRGLVVPGGVAYDVDDALVEEMIGRLDSISRDASGAIELLWNNPSVLARFEGTGAISEDLARQIGLVGVAARASGLACDVRQEFPFGLYQFTQMPVCTWPSGDCFARAYVRWLEVQQSLEFVAEQLRSLPGYAAAQAGFAPAQPGGAIRPSDKPLRPGMIAVTLVEGWRGEICHVAATDAAGRFAWYKVVDPSFHNWFGVACALRGQQISDFPLCNKSFNLSYCGHDL